MCAVDSSIRALLRAAPVVPVYTPGNTEEAVRVAQCLVRGGLPIIEVTLRNARAIDAARAVVEWVPEAIVAVGTVLHARQLEQARQLGVHFAVSPGLDPRLLDCAREIGLPYLPGIATPSELMQGIRAGVDTFKFFPAEQAGGAAMLASFAGPFPDARFCPTGGITAASAPHYLRLPNVLCVGGSWVLPAGALSGHDWSAIETLARQATALRS
ncbi:bifunctional 4-hydroxy-2-oxoglutarate aldolase/2-dehydro-3-deoxy-phosphogluconate aldolase [Arenimonas sp.]|uniref:bifunctional 4-hydroxy-2-oxoglutarate aldolase/2-dehydro-3-deoxy-phosphogluconate aldolase n=1 Tax=Arenimonas sp. TaxID=1872635 RepID=UPI0039E71E52